MAFEESWRELMASTVQLAAPTARDKFGARTFGTNITYDAYVVDRNERVIDFKGADALAIHKIWIAPHRDSGLPSPRSDWRLTMADGTTPPILRVEVFPDEDGPHHVLIWAGSGGRV